MGQALNVVADTVASGERPELVAPRVAGASLTPVGTSSRPVVTSAIGDLVSETRQFVYHYRLVAERPGALTIPPFVARQGERSGRSNPIRVEVRALPVRERPPTFLGGVGPLEVATEARPDSSRVGQTMEYRIRLEGPGAFGSTRAPDLERLDRLPIEPEVRALPTEFVPDPPSRVFRYRIRPTKSGEVVLPPLVVSWFDPRTGRYLSRVGPGVPIRVADVPAFDPATLDYRAPAPRIESRPRRGALALVGGLGLLLSIGLAAWVRRSLRRLRRDPRRLALRLSRRFRTPPAPDAARRVTEALADYLHAAVGRPAGALTPGEARAGIARASSDTELGERAGRLVARCDRARYADREGSDDGRDLFEEAYTLFDALARHGRGFTAEARRARRQAQKTKPS